MQLVSLTSRAFRFVSSPTCRFVSLSTLLFLFLRPLSLFQHSILFCSQLSSSGSLLFGTFVTCALLSFANYLRLAHSQSRVQSFAIPHLPFPTYYAIQGHPVPSPTRAVSPSLASGFNFPYIRPVSPFFTLSFPACHLFFTYIHSPHSSSPSPFQNLNN
jgi:hypothetical protein